LVGGGIMMIGFSWWQDALGGILVIAIATWVMAKVMPLGEPKTIKGSDLQKTKEGRDLLIGFQERGPSSIPLVVTPCKSCDGTGVTTGEMRALMGTQTNVHLCEPCGGTGLEGGADYVVKYCKACVTRNAISSNCTMCSGSGVMKVKKEAQPEKS
jgi:hypothetical protein